MESNLDDQILTNRFAFNSREFNQPVATNTVVGIGLSVQCNSNQVVIPIGINEAIRIVRMSSRFAVAGGTKDITFADAGINVQAQGGLIAPDIFPAPAAAPGGGLGNFGIAVDIEDEIYYGTDYASVGFAPPSLIFFGFIDAFGGAAAHTVIAQIGVTFERFILKPTATLRG